uniref:ELF3 protein n=1 Tax=Glycine max TaxID=3847 RepID=A0A1S6YGD1_SOYBN|nr:ELF3 protein [Glycine max]
MKRGKDDEKVMGPMFPRLHVNDTEKGGPRAPPRNKMALYEQFSIPSQRFNSGVLPLNPNISSNTVPPASSSLRTVPERNCVYPVHLPPQRPIHRAEKCNSRQSEGTNLSASLEQRKKVDEDDFGFLYTFTPGLVNVMIRVLRVSMGKNSLLQALGILVVPYQGKVIVKEIQSSLAPQLSI